MSQTKPACFNSSASVSPCPRFHATDSTSHSALVVVATYNENTNLQPLARNILAQSPHLQILIVDDNSPDGTGVLAQSLATKEPRLHVLHRAEKQGLGPALTEGFRWALHREFDFIVNLDGDHSHDPVEIPALLAATELADVAIGSRYVNGIRVFNWSPRRLLLSLGAARYIRLMTGMAVADPTSGFRCFRRAALEEALKSPLISRGYGFHFEVLHRIWRAGGKIVEVPICYRNRTQGVSKMSAGIVGEAVWLAFRLLAQNGFRRVPRKRQAVGNDRTASPAQSQAAIEIAKEN